MMGKEIPIGAKLTYYRIFRGVTQENLARRTGVSVQTIRNYESGKTIPDSEFLAQFAKILKIPSDLIINEPIKNTEEKLSELFSGSIHVDEAEKERVNKLILEYREEKNLY